MQNMQDIKTENFQELGDLLNLVLPNLEKSTVSNKMFYIFGDQANNRGDSKLIFYSTDRNCMFELASQFQSNCNNAPLDLYHKDGFYYFAIDKSYLTRNYQLMNIQEGNAEKTAYENIKNIIIELSNSDSLCKNGNNCYQEKIGKVIQINAFKFDDETNKLIDPNTFFKKEYEPNYLNPEIIESTKINVVSKKFYNQTVKDINSIIRLTNQMLKETVDLIPLIDGEPTEENIQKLNQQFTTTKEQIDNIKKEHVKDNIKAIVKLEEIVQRVQKNAEELQYQRKDLRDSSLQLVKAFNDNTGIHDLKMKVLLEKERENNKAEEKLKKEKEEQEKKDIEKKPPFRLTRFQTSSDLKISVLQAKQLSVNDVKNLATGLTTKFNTVKFDIKSVPTHGLVISMAVDQDKTPDIKVLRSAVLEVVLMAFSNCPTDGEIPISGKNQDVVDFAFYAASQLNAKLPPDKQRKITGNATKGYELRSQKDFDDITRDMTIIRDGCELKFNDRKNTNWQKLVPDYKKEEMDRDITAYKLNGPSN